MFDIFVKGGWIMLPLVLCSVVAVTIIVDRFFFFQRFGALDLVDKVLGLIEQGDMLEVKRLLKERKTPVLRVLEAGISSRSNAAKAMEAAGITEVALMRRGLSVLDTIITLSPLLGLLGTIIGMIQAFQIMGSLGMGQPQAITGGVAEALIATATGIAIAAITLIPYNYFLARIEGETEHLEQCATRLELIIDALPGSEIHENTKKYA